MRSRVKSSMGTSRTSVYSPLAVTTQNGEYKVIDGLEIDAFSQERINLTLKELQEEQAGVAHLL